MKWCSQTELSQTAQERFHPRVSKLRNEAVEEIRRNHGPKRRELMEFASSIGAKRQAGANVNLTPRFRRRTVGPFERSP